MNPKEAHIAGIMAEIKRDQQLKHDANIRILIAQESLKVLGTTYSAELLLEETKKLLEGK